MTRLMVVALTVVATALAQDVRNMAMGQLSLLLESDINRLDMYDFGRNPAGLYRAAPVRFAGSEEDEGIYQGFDFLDEGATLPEYSYTEVSLTGYTLKAEGIDLFDVYSIGQPIPSEMYDFMVPNYYTTGLEIFPYRARPAGGYMRSRGSGGATMFEGGWSNAGLKYSEDSRQTMNTPQLAFGRAGSAGPVDYGFSAFGCYIMESEPGISGQLLGPGVGAGLVMPASAFSWGADVVYYHPVLHESWAGGDTTLQGNVLGPGVSFLAQPVDSLRFGLRGEYRYTRLAEATYESPWASLRGLFSRADIPVVAGVEATWTKTTLVSGDTASTGTFIGGAGLGLRIPVLFVGAEARYTMFGESAFDSVGLRTLALQAGAEVSFGVSHLRLGYGRSSMTYTGDTSKVNRAFITGGFGIDLATGRMDLAYNYLPHDPAQSYARKYTEHVLYLSFKFGA